MNFHELYRKIEAIDKGQSLQEFDLKKLNPFAKKEPAPAAAPGQSAQPAPAGAPGQSSQPADPKALLNPEFAKKLTPDARMKAAGLDEGSGIEFNGNVVDPRSIEIDGVDRRDYPDFADAYVSYAEYTDGTPLSDRELDVFTDHHGDIVNQLAHDSLHESTVNECGDSMMSAPMEAPKQADSVTMNVSMNGSGAGGIRDLLNVLKDIQDGPADDMSGGDMDVGHDMDAAADQLLKKNIDSMATTIDDDFGNSIAGDPGPEMMPAHDAGDDLHKEKGAYPKANGGDNAMKIKSGTTIKLPEGPLKIKLENLYNEIKSR